MGTINSTFRITRTDKDSTPWVGFSAVVKINEIYNTLEFPNGDTCKYLLINATNLKIPNGKHQGIYLLENIY
jgi:hypothetical protein